jgi:hypothetical protein
LGGRDQEDCSLRSAQVKKFLRAYLKGKKLDMVCVCHLRDSGKHKTRIAVQAGLNKKQDPMSKITRVKKAGGMVQTVMGLSNKRKALSSNTSTVSSPKFGTSHC